MLRNIRSQLFLIIFLGLGLWFGFFPWQPITDFAPWITTIFIRLLKLISLPMIFLAIVSTLNQMSSMKEAGNLLKLIVRYTMITTLIAATIGMVLFLIIQPVKVTETTNPFVSSPINYLSFLLQIIPENLIQPFLDNNVLGMTFMATILGLITFQLPTEQSTFLRKFFSALFAALLKITSLITRLIPIAIFGFTIELIHTIRKDSENLEELLLYGLCVVGANLIQGFVILPILLKSHRLSPIRIAKGMFPALSMAFFSKSSGASLPLALECAKNRLRISEKTANFSLPLCSIINMNGCAAFILITLFFVCSSQGISFSLIEMIGWIFIATFAAIGNAGIPMGCFFMTTAFLVSLNTPVALMGMILPLYTFFDMIETALNVWSDSCVTSIVDQKCQPMEAK